MKKIATLALSMAFAMLAHAQTAGPVRFTSQLVTHDDAQAEIVFTGAMAPGWHVYSTDLGSEGPIQASFNVNKLNGVELVGKLTADGHEINKFDKLFGMQLRYFENSVRFVQKVRFTKPSYTIDAYLEYGACNDQNCMPPAQADIKRQGTAPKIYAPTATTRTAGKKPAARTRTATTTARSRR